MDLKEIMKQMWAEMDRNDLSEDYLEKNGCSLPVIGEFQYGVSSVPCAWVYPFLYALATDERFKDILKEIEENPEAYMGKLEERHERLDRQTGGD